MLALTLTGYVLGRRLTCGVCYASRAEAVVFSLGCGLGGLAYLTFGLGLLGLLTAPAVLAVGVAVHLAGWRVWRSVVGGLRPPRPAPGRCGPAGRVWRLVAYGLRPALGARRSVVGVGLLTLVAVAPIVVGALYPPTGFDATMYHLPYAKTYVQTHQLVVTPFLRFPVSPQTNEMLFTLALLLAGDVATQVIELILLLLTSLAVYAWGCDRFSPRVGAWAAALWLGSPLVVWLGTHAYVDVGLALFVTLGAFAFSNWTSRADGRWLILAGVCLGLAAATKYTGVFFVAAFGLAAVFARRRWSSAVVLVLVAAGVAAPWYVRNTLLAGDPVSPFLLPIFGDRFWSADDLARHSGSWNDHGLGKSVLDLVLLPWNLTFRYASFDPGPRLSPLYVLAAFGLVSARLRPLLALAGAYTLVWFATAQIPRFLLPELPVLALATAAAIDRLRCRCRRLPLLHTGLAAGLVAALLFAPGWVWSIRQLREQGPLPLTAAARQAFLATQLPSYPAYALLNQTHGSDYVLYALYDEDMHYYADGRVEGDWFGPARYPDLLANLADGASLDAQLQRYGAGYLLVSTRGHAVPLPGDAFFRAHFRELYAGPTTRLFEVYP